MEATELLLSECHFYQYKMSSFDSSDVALNDFILIFFF